MHTKSITKAGTAAMKKVAGVVKKYGFYLAGGTGLALRLGHRQSADFDFFSESSFTNDMLFRELEKSGLNPKVMHEDRDTLWVTTGEGIKLSFFSTPYQLLEKSKMVYGVPVAALKDLAAMKITATTHRSAKRDFYDLYYLLQNISPEKMASCLVRKYGVDRLEPVHIGKSMVYFYDAESDEPPLFYDKNPPKWGGVKKFMKDYTKKLVIALTEKIEEHF